MTLPVPRQGAQGCCGACACCSSEAAMRPATLAIAARAGALQDPAPRMCDRATGKGMHSLDLRAPPRHNARMPGGRDANGKVVALASRA